MNAFATLVILFCWFFVPVVYITERLSERLAEKFHKFFGGDKPYEPYERD